MKWHLAFSDTGVDQETMKVLSACSITIEHEGEEMTIYSSTTPDEHLLSTRKALMESGYLLRRIGAEMIKKAEKVF